MAYVHTLGGRTLDNAYFCVLDKEDCIEKRLQKELNQLKANHYQVVSHAFALFTAQSILQGDIVGKGLHEFRMGSYRRHKQIEDGAPLPQVKPLADLKRAVVENPNKTHFVVFSILDEDFLLHHTVDDKISRRNPLRLLWDISAIQKRHLEILRQLGELKEQGVKPILMTPFRWDPHHDRGKIYPLIQTIGIAGLTLQTVCAASLALSTRALVARKIDLMTVTLLTFSAAAYYGSTFLLNFRATKGILSGQSIKIATLGYLFERTQTPVLAQAKKEGIPVFDLTNSLNPCGYYNNPPSSPSYSEDNPCNNDYTFGYHPTLFGSKLIAEGICHIIQNHDFSQPISFIYSKEPEPRVESYFAAEKRTFQPRPNPGAHGWTVQFPKV